MSGEGPNMSRKWTLDMAARLSRIVREECRIAGKRAHGIPCIVCGGDICTECWECHNKDCSQYAPCEAD